jgi:AraC-like DNA-binding protein
MKGDIPFHLPDRPANVLQTVELKEDTLILPSPMVNSTISQWLFDGICMRHSVHHFNDYLSFSKQNETDAISLSFNIRGHVLITQEGTVYEVHDQQHNIIYANGYMNTFENKTLDTENLSIQFSPDAFLQLIQGSNDTMQRFAERLLEGGPVVIAQQSLATSAAMQRAIQDIIHCTYSGHLKKLFLLSKSIELLVLSADAWHQAFQYQERQQYGRDDRERIHYAREYLVNNVELPPSLSELSRIVGINEFKLKKKFKEEFNTTVFGYLSDYRLGMARNFLQDSNKAISDIAYELGYSSPQHFSAAFKKKFGVSPSELKQ